MSTAIHTRYTGSAIVARADRGAATPFKVRLPYPHELPQSAKHPAAAKKLADAMNWSGLWIVGHNGDGSIVAVHVPGTYSRAWVDKFIPGIEGEDFFYVVEQPR